MDKFCPYCQMPFRLLHVQSSSLHLECCFRKRKPKKECPKGVRCESCMICHFERFAHTALANKRNPPKLSQPLEINSSPEVNVKIASTFSINPSFVASPKTENNSFVKSNLTTTTVKSKSSQTLDTEPLTPHQDLGPILTPPQNPEPVPTVTKKSRVKTSEITKNLNKSGVHLSDDMEAKINLDNNSKTKLNSYLLSELDKIKDQGSPLKDINLKMDKVNDEVQVKRKLVELNETEMNKNLNIKRPKLDKKESSQGLEINNNSDKLINKNLIFKNTESTEDSEEWPIFQPKGHGFVPKFNDNDSGKCTDSSLSDEDMFIETNLNISGSSSGFGFTSTQVENPNQQNSFINFANFQSQVVSPIKNHTQSFITKKKDTKMDKKNKDVKINNSLPTKPVEILKESNFLTVKKEANAIKQGDIGAMLFGIKPKEKVVKKTEVNVGKQKRSCPFYKKVEGTTFAVDAFNYGEVPGITHYFLSHFHYDHYMGLTKNWVTKIYCSSVTGNLVQLKIKLADQQIKRIKLNDPVVICDVEITLLEANHCPGAVLILMKLKNGKTILHTGDFRADNSLINNPIIKDYKINLLYLDTTYLNPNYSFPPQNDVVSFTSTAVWKLLQEEPKTLIVTGSYFIGKEKIFLDLGKELESKVYVKNEKYKTMMCYEDKKLKSMLTTDKLSTNIHVLQMKELATSNLYDYLAKFGKKYKQIVAIKPTGWTHSKKSNNLENIQPSRNGKVLLYGVPYSEHSSFSELKMFVESLKPDRIIPTVNIGKPETRKMMESYLNKWKEK